MSLFDDIKNDPAMSQPLRPLPNAVDCNLRPLTPEEQERIKNEVDYIPMNSPVIEAFYELIGFDEDSRPPS